MATVEKKATVKLRRARAITQYKEWIGSRSWDEIPHTMKVKMFDHYVDKNSK